ncbi:hypothetical protein [Poriferisphaera sp. WC338]|uniref:hypothetical protein n=1 Tax=Poriferisphaera sp. WC338 TaxID=3425129 RepID=UPI003D8168FE
MGKDSEQVKKFTALLKKIKSKHKGLEAVSREPVLQLVMSFLQWEATETQAEEAIEKLLGAMVDINEIRVTHHHELIDIIGAKYPFAEERISRMREALNAVYLVEHSVTMKSIEGKGKKEQKAYLEALPAMPGYVLSQMMLLCFGGHAMPVDRRLGYLLEKEGVVEDGSNLSAVESFLLKQVKASECLDVHLVLQAWADSQNVSGLKMKSTVIEMEETVPSLKPITKKVEKKKAPAKKAAASKSNKKKAEPKKKTVAKKAATKKTAKKKVAKKSAAKKTTGKTTKKKTSKKK